MTKKLIVPVATPPNAIAFSAAGKDASTIDMMRTGIFLNFTCISVLFIMHITYGNVIFNFSDYKYAETVNTTMAY